MGKKCMVKVVEEEKEKRERQYSKEGYVTARRG